MTAQSALLNKALQLARTSSRASFSQMIILALGFVSGLLIIRFLSPENYALYTIAYSFLSTMKLLSDGGIQSAIISEGGKVWKDPEKLGRVVVTGLKLRKRFSLIAMAVSLPIMMVFLGRHGASTGEILILTLSLLPLFYVQLSEDLLYTVPKLHQWINETQAIGLRTSLLRLGLLIVTLLTLPYAATVILATGFASAYSLWRMRQTAEEICDLEQAEDPEVKQSAYKVMRRMMPNAVYISISGALSIWLISIFGETQSVAEVGAIDRLARLMLIVSCLFSLIIVPRFARLEERETRLIRTRFLQVYGVVWLIGCAIAIGICLFPQPLVWLLGREYADLTYEIQLRGMVMGLVFIANSLNELMSSRAWIIPPLPLILGQIVSQIIGILVCDVSTTAGVIILIAFPYGTMIFLRSIYALIVLSSLGRSEGQTSPPTADEQGN